MALKIKNKTMQFGGQLGGKTLLIVFLVVSLVLVIAYSREGEDGPLHSLQNTRSFAPPKLYTLTKKYCPCISPAQCRS